MKRKTLIGIGFLTILILAGCEESKIVYEGEYMKKSQAEEIIADKLEVENPDLDLEIIIYDESDE